MIFNTHYTELFLASSPDPEKLRLAIDSVNPDQFLKTLSADHMPTIPYLDCDQPKFYWIFRNMDFRQWNNASYFQVLWLSGPPECSIHQVSSYVVNKATLKPECCVLYFFCSAAAREKSVVSRFIQTLLYQIICCSPVDKKISIVRKILHILVDGIFKREGAYNVELTNFEGSPDIRLSGVVDGPTDELWTALEAVLADEQARELLIVVDGLDKVLHEKQEFISAVRAFVGHLQQRISKVKILLTSQPSNEIKNEFDEFPSIEYDKERKGCTVSHISL